MIIFENTWFTVELNAGEESPVIMFGQEYPVCPECVLELAAFLKDGSNLAVKKIPALLREPRRPNQA